MDYCPGHPGYDEDFRGNCKFCGYPRKPSRKVSPFGDYVDPFALARGLQARENRKNASGFLRLTIVLIAK